jgi:pyridoxamine 5'-phosphate oxidase
MSTLDPIQRFDSLYAEARQADPTGHDAVCLATVGDDGRPSARIVLLKAFDAQGFVFYTNYQSRKGRELLGHPFAALCFYWPALGRQVRVEGRITEVTPAEADAYFASRPRGSQIGAWASQQSQELHSREELIARVDELTKRYEGGPVPRPPHWSGFRLNPDRIEFWTSEPNRLHRRELFTKGDAGWSLQLLNP